LKHNVLSRYVTHIQYLVWSTRQRKYSRPPGHDVTSYDVSGNCVPFINCKKTVTQPYKSATFPFHSYANNTSNNILIII